jgi:hypothetical protein
MKDDLERLVNPLEKLVKSQMERPTSAVVTPDGHFNFQFLKIGNFGRAG